MKKIKEYNIGFKGLKNGLHTFKYTVNKDFFALFESALYENGNSEVTVNLTKSEQMLILDFDINGTIESVCDHCLEEVNMPINCQSRLYVNFGEEYDEPSEEIIILPHAEHEINVARFIYDVIATSLPIKHVHGLDQKGKSTCNPEMVNKLSEYLVDQEPGADDSEEEIDPRWDELKKLLDKNK
ncbi:YceD family protein [Alkalitalea saponilacus]|uniref:Uncharacterized metal-binding protein YceD, DUF177 family n=1 Tax=Alkalitalea saponilacus TaxID=889453 RepID=A0A1T5HMY4_9BACT|nr:DUF177 domain-containing protein [Alkalitalea saponilacus]SKC21891.1 Uncharacterized metal-binding protein YceD, DUF177 family [Alkalitalea saponilacus]